MGVIFSKSAGISLTSNVKVDSLSNSGDIVFIGEKSGATWHGHGAGIFLDHINNKQPIVETLNNQGNINNFLFGIHIKQGTINNINNGGTIIAQNNGVLSRGHLGAIVNTNTIIGISGFGMDINNADSITLEGENSLIGGGDTGIINHGNINNDISLNDNATIAALTFSEDGSTYTYNQEGTAILNQGNIQGNINLNGGSKIIGALHNKNTIGGNISLDNKSYITSINNEKTIQGSIDLKNKSHIDSIINSGTIEKGINLNQSTIGSIANSGSIGNGGIKLNDSTIGSITNNEGAKTDLDLKNNSVVGTITNNGDMLITRDETSSIGTFANNGNLKNTFENKDTLGTLENTEGAILEKGLNNDNGSIGLINNAGTIASITNTFNDKTKDAKENKGYICVITNTGTIGSEIVPLIAGKDFYGVDNSGTIDLLKNEKNGNIYGGVNNSGYINIENTGNIHGGITNSGTLVVSNGHIHPATANNEATWHSGYIGKNNNGYQLENNTGGKISIDGWYFDELEYTGNTQADKDKRLENSIIIGGDNLGGISADKIYVNTEKLKLQTVYEGNTFFADKDGNIVGDKTNNGAGVNGYNIHSLSGIYDFIGLGNGQYVANVNLAELSGKTLAKSMVYSSRLRNINISNMLRDVTSQNFQTEFSQVLDMELSKKGEAYGNDADLLAELEDIFIPNKNPKASNHSFLLPYYNHSSIKIGKSVGQLSVNTTGLMGGSFKELPKDYGIIGFYLGYEDSSKEQATQRLKFDDKTYYGGLTYYGVIARNGIDQYYISANTKLDYTKTDIEKTYKNIPSSIKSDAKVYGYGAEVKLGANYYNTLDIARISPEIGLSYYGMSNKNFALRHIDGLKEHYMAEQFNFFDAIAAVKLYKPLSDKLRTNITIGSVVNLYNDAKGSLKLGPNEISTDIDTSKYYGFGQLGLSYAIADNADLSLNYAGAFTFDNTTSHTMFLKLGLWW